MKINSIIPLAILGLTVTLVAFGFIDPKPDLDVKEYRNETFGYSFQYPTTCTFGPMPRDCKQNPPEERRQECLCFLDAEKADEVFLQAFLGDREEGLTLATFSIASYDSPAYSPPAGTELVSWLEGYFVEKYSDIPEGPNVEIGGLPAVELYSPGSPMAPSSREIYFIKDNRLVQVSMLDVENEVNMALYDLILSSFSWEE
jgi:hypothetical protein